MAQLGHLIGGKFVKDIGSFGVADLPAATETTDGLMTPQDKKKLDNAYSTDDVASISSIEGLFN